MPIYILLITQMLRVERHVTVEVEAADLEAALEQQREADAPAYEDPGWISYPDLMNETVVAAEDQHPILRGAAQ